MLGSAGEFPDLNEQERLDFFRFYAEYVNGRVELLAGTGCIRYADTLALSNAVYELGYTPMVISPYYFEMDQEKPFVYYDRLAKDVKGDLYLYNFPPRTGHSIAPETIRRLIDANPNIIGLKDSVSTPGHTNMVCRAVEGKPFTVYSLSRVVRPAELHFRSAEENCSTENVSSLRSVKVATPPCAAKATIPCVLAVRKRF